MNMVCREKPAKEPANFFAAELSVPCLWKLIQGMQLVDGHDGVEGGYERFDRYAVG